MNITLQEALAALIKATLEGTDYLIAQIPEVLIQLLRWEFTISLVYWLTGIILIASIKYIWWLSQDGKLRDGDGDPAFAVIYSIIALGGGVAIIICNLTWLQIAIAPKVFLLEYATKLVI